MTLLCRLCCHNPCSKVLLRLHFSFARSKWGWQEKRSANGVCVCLCSKKKVFHLHTRCTHNAEQIHINESLHVISTWFAIHLFLLMYDLLKKTHRTHTPQSRRLDVVQFDGHVVLTSSVHKPNKRMKIDAKRKKQKNINRFFLRKIFFRLPESSFFSALKARNE